MLEFGTWLLDELKDRCFGLNDRKLEKWYKETRNELEALDKKAKEDNIADSAFALTTENLNTSNNITDTGKSEQYSSLSETHSQV